MRALLRHRDRGSTIFPSDASRVVAGDRFRPVMPQARSVAAELSRGGVVRVTQRGMEADASSAKGPLRIGRGPRWGGQEAADG